MPPAYANNEHSLVLLVTVLTLFKERRVDLDKHLEGVVDHAMDGPTGSHVYQSAYATPSRRQDLYSPVPVRSRVGEQGREDEREDDLDVFAHQGNDIRIVPVIQRSFGDLCVANRHAVLDQRFVPLHIA